MSNLRDEPIIEVQSEDMDDAIDKWIEMASKCRAGEHRFIGERDEKERMCLNCRQKIEASDE